MRIVTYKLTNFGYCHVLIWLLFFHNHSHPSHFKNKCRSNFGKCENTTCEKKRNILVFFHAHTVFEACILEFFYWNSSTLDQFLAGVDCICLHSTTDRDTCNEVNFVIISGVMKRKKCYKWYKVKSNFLPF